MTAALTTTNNTRPPSDHTQRTHIAPSDDGAAHICIISGPLPSFAKDEDLRCLAERVPSACPFSGSRGVNSGHSRHLFASTRRSAYCRSAHLIVARSPKLAMRVRFPSPAPQPPPAQTAALLDHEKDRHQRSCH